MLSKITDALKFQSAALKLRGQRQDVLTSNITNADTPGYKAVDFDFASALADASKLRRGNTPGTATTSNNNTASELATTDSRHLQSGSASGLSTAMQLRFRNAVMPSIDGNTVDLETERAQFAENALKYEASLRAINGQLKTLQTAMSGSSGQ
jgi:flagellar basal-body rod protein FlgB